MTKNDIIQQLYEDKTIRDICMNVSKSSHFTDDLVQEIFLILLEYEDSKIIELYEKKQLKFFITKVITNQFNSKTSKFYRRFKRSFEELKPEHENIIDDND